MQAIHHYLDAGMVYPDPDALRVEKYYSLPPKLGLALRIVIGCASSRSSIARYPKGDKDLGDGGNSDILDGRGFRPLGKPLSHGHDIPVPLVDWEQANDVEVHMLDAAMWYKKHMWGRALFHWHLMQANRRIVDFM